MDGYDEGGHRYYGTDEKVLIYENGAVEVVFYYDDVYQEMCQSILEMQKKQEAIS